MCFSFSKGEKELGITAANYTGNNMTLVCEPSINVEDLRKSEWTFRGRVIKQTGKRKITNSNTRSVLRIEKANAVDIGKQKLVK